MNRLGWVQELMMTSDATHVAGLLLDGGGLLHPARILDYQGVLAVSETHLIAKEVYLPEAAKLRRRRELQGIPVLFASGAEAGILDDFIFDPLTGQVKELVLTRGLVDDLFQGKALLQLEAPLMAGESAMVLQDGTEESGGTFQ